MAQNAVEESPRSAKRPRPRNPFAAVALFLRQVMDELRKVVTPTWRELVSYTLVVLVFVVIMMLLVTGLDTVFGSVVRWVFAGIDPFDQ